jgi:hypothetical protein
VLPPGSVEDRMRWIGTLADASSRIGTSTK